MKDSANKFAGKTKKAFTLIELLVTLAIITILATASVPQVQMWTARNRGKAAVSNIVSDFAKAKSIAGYSMKDDGDAPSSSIYHDYHLQRPVTAIVFRKSSYSIVQRPSSIKESTTWKDINDGTHVVVKKVPLPNSITIEIINTGPTNDGTGATPTIVFTSTGRAKKNDGTFVPLGAGAGALKCGSENSVLDGRRILKAEIKAQVSDDYAVWYRVEIDPAGEFFVCSKPDDESGTDFLGDEANILQM